MKSSKILLAASFILQSSLAIAGEDTWTAVTIQLPSLQNQISGFQTDSGSFRLERADHSKSTVVISGSSLGRDIEKAKSFCQLQGPSLRRMKEHSKNSFKLEALAYPIADEELGRAGIQIENKPSLYNFEVRLTTSEKSFTTRDAAESFQSMAEGKIKAQMETLRSSGRFSIELSQIDDVACDLILGTAQLSLHFGLSQKPAKHQRETVITGEELSKVYEVLKQVHLQNKDISQRHILSGALLGSVLQKELGKSLRELEEKKFLQIHQGLFNKETAILKPLSENQYETMARSMDLLSLDLMMVLLKTDFQAKLGGR